MRPVTATIAVIRRRGIFLCRPWEARSSRLRRRDPRIGLKAGLHDAGTAARNMELVSSLAEAAGIFRSKGAGGAFQRRPSARGNRTTEREKLEREHELAGTQPPPRPGANNLNFGNSDHAFHDNHLFMGSFHGFNVYDIENPRRPRQIASVVCPGGQGDVSVHGHLLFMSVEQNRGRIDCGTGGVSDKVSAERFRGIRIFDIRDMRNPKQVGGGADLSWIAYAYAGRGP